MIISNVSDPDSGITSYKYEVFENIGEITEDSVPVAVIEKGNSASATLNVDNNVIKRGVPYIFRVVMEFYDNEKSYEYVSNFSNVMKLDGVEFPMKLLLKELEEQLK